MGHGSILHGPVLEEHVEIGMGAIIMDNVRIGAGSCIGAGALVTAGTYIGVTAKDAGEITLEMSKYMDYATGVYIKLPPRCFKGLVQLDIKDVIAR